MAQAQTTAKTTDTDTTDTNGKSKREPKTLTAVDALKKIQGILDQLTPSGRKRVLAFINASDETEEPGEATE